MAHRRQHSSLGFKSYSLAVLTFLFGMLFGAFNATIVKAGIETSMAKISQH